jgi:hypothetical protein
MFILGKPLQMSQNVMQWRQQRPEISDPLLNVTSLVLRCHRFLPCVRRQAYHLMQVKHPRRTRLIHVGFHLPRDPSQASLHQPFLPNPEPNDAEQPKAFFSLPGEEPDSEAKREDERETSPTPKNPIN